MITQNGYQGSLVTVVGANEFPQYAAGKGPQPWPLNYRTKLAGWWRRESVAGPYGSREFWLSAYYGGPSGQQVTVSKQPIYIPGDANTDGTLTFVPGSQTRYVLPASFYDKLSGPVSSTIIIRARPRVWALTPIVAVSSPVFGAQFGVIANPAWSLITKAGFMSSESTDVSQTIRYVAFVCDQTPGAQSVNIVERGKRTSAVAVAADDVYNGAFIGNDPTEANPYSGQVDEIIALQGALTDAEIKSALPYLYRDRYMNLLCYGNSIFAGYAGQTPFLCQLEDALPAGYGVSAAFCRGSITTADLLVAAKERTVGQVIPGATRVLFWEETNSIILGATFEQLKAQGQAVRDYFFSIGVDVIRATVLPRSAFNASQNAVRTAWNNELKQRPLLYASRADMVIKWDEDVRLQNPANLAVYSDGTHPTTLGASYMVEDAIPVLLSL